MIVTSYRSLSGAPIHCGPDHRQHTAGKLLLQNHKFQCRFPLQCSDSRRCTRSSLCQLGIGQSWRYSATSASVNWWTASTTREITRSLQETFMKSASCSAHRTTSLIRSSMVCLFDVLSIGHPAPRGRLLCQLLNRLISFLNHLQHIRVKYTEHQICTQHDEHNRESNSH